MKKDFSRKEVEAIVNEFSDNPKGKTPDDIKRMKKLAMSKNVKLKNARKLFCKKCLSLYGEVKIRIRKGIKSVTCEKCGFVNRWNIR